ncbi:MAG: hypothetical protein FWC50_07525, partial [Planctomycetaceae bacterium]|nr:hypothetical protein [Planctomycetaceae bacterium]
MFEKNCPKSRSIALLGSTGSIGRSTLDVVRAAQGRLPVFALSAHANIPLLREQMDEFRPRQVVVTDHSKKPGDFPDLVETAKKTGADLFFGSEALCRMVAQPEVEVIVSAIVGSAGLQSTLSALEAGKTVALANKESLVVGGELVKKAESKHGGRIIPIDSEHSAIWQCLEAGGGRREAGDMAQSSSLQSPVSRLILTASGGPFRKFSQQELERV